MNSPLLSHHDADPGQPSQSPATYWEENAVEGQPLTRPNAPKTRLPLWVWLLLATLAAVALGALTYLLLQPPPTPAAKPVLVPAPEIKRKELVKNVLLETQGDTRRVVILTTVVHREGQLEGLLTKARTKEHEYILAFDGDAIHIHTALLAAGAEAGSPVKFEPRYAPATGTTIKATVRYEKAGRRISHPAQEWIQNVNTKKQLDQDWVFGGSHLVEDRENAGEKVYLANYGDLICLCNMDTAMLDLPVRSPKKFDDRLFHAWTERIPPEGTKVELILEPVKKPQKN